jgi:coenzyme F420-reducing hydrogenase beta subunit
VSKHFTGFLLAAAGLTEAKVKTVDFRYSARSRKATNFAFRAQHAAGNWSNLLYFDGLYGALWTGRFFVPRACDFCDDLFAPLADATFMDAWLPEYTGDVHGTSIVVARHSEVSRLMQGAKESGAFLRPITIARVRQSQSGALAYKTTYLPLRVARAERNGLKIPRSFPRAVVPGGLKERLAKIKHGARARICRLAFDLEGRPRRLWTAVLAACLQGQRLCRAARRRVARL